MSKLRRPVGPVVLLLTLPLCGCVERIISVRSDPSGAEVFINGKQAGTTPLEHEIDFYGALDVVVRHEGHLSRRTRIDPTAPWHQVFPVDFVAEFLVPWTIRDQHDVLVTLEALPQEYDVELVEQLKSRARAERDRVRRESAASESGTGTEPPEVED